MSMKRPRHLAVVGVLGGAVLIAVLIVLLRSGDTRDRLTAAGTVEATDARLGFQLAGRIVTVAAHEGAAVQAGEELARLDQEEVTARREQAVAQVAAARAFLSELERGSRSEEVAQARAARDAAQKRVTDAARDLQRAASLFQGGAISREAYDKAALRHELAIDQLEQADEQLKLVRSGPRPERLEAQRAQVVQARASLRAIEASLANMIIVAPFDGIVTVRHHEPGETVGAGVPVVTLMNPNDRWVRIYVREDRIGAVKLGMPARISTDTYPDKMYEGDVVFIASEAEFTPKSVQTSEERVKLVYAVKVRIGGDPGYDLKPGLPADVRLDLEPS
jgi:HlyD family secretion protein